MNEITAPFHTIATRLTAIRAKPTFTEAVMLHTFAEVLSEGPWRSLQGTPRLHLRRLNRGADILVSEPNTGVHCLAIELKDPNRHPELKVEHVDQARNYANDLKCACLLTNGFEYRVIYAASDEYPFAGDGLQGRRRNLLASDFSLGHINPHAFNQPLEGQLLSIVTAAAASRATTDLVFARLNALSRPPPDRNLLSAVQREPMSFRRLSAPPKAEPGFSGARSVTHLAATS